MYGARPKGSELRNTMKTKDNSVILPQFHLFDATVMVAVILMLGMFASSAQTGQYLFTGSERTITLNPGIYNITAYGATGGYFETSGLNIPGGSGALMSGEFYFSATTTLTLLVGGAGGTGAVFGGGGGGGSFIVNGTTPLVVAGGGGGGFFDSTGTFSGVGQPGLITTGGGTYGDGSGTGGAGGNGGSGTAHAFGGGGGGGGFYSNGGHAAAGNG